MNVVAIWELKCYGKRKKKDVNCDKIMSECWAIPRAQLAHCMPSRGLTDLAFVNI
jgi:hypothetical protein